MSTSLNNHVKERGTVPVVTITNWDTYITLSIEVGKHSTTSYIRPAEGQTIDELILAIRTGLVDVAVELPRIDRELYV